MRKRTISKSKTNSLDGSKLLKLQNNLRTKTTKYWGFLREKNIRGKYRREFWTGHKTAGNKHHDVWWMNGWLDGWLCGKQQLSFYGRFTFFLFYFLPFSSVKFSSLVRKLCLVVRLGFYRNKLILNFWRKVYILLFKHKFFTKYKFKKNI